MSDEKPLGRPSLYKPEYCDQILDYFSVEPYEEKIKKVHTKSGDVIELPYEVAADFPSFAGFAAKIGVHRESLLNWTEQFPDFFDAYKRAKDLQENFILINGHKSLINTAFGIFTAKNVLGYRDKHPGEDDRTITHAGEVKVDRIDLEDRIKLIKGIE